MNINIKGSVQKNFSDSAKLLELIKSYEKEQLSITDLQSMVLEEILAFSKWLNTNNYSQNVYDVNTTIIEVEPFSKDDWTMRVREKNGKQLVSFNPNLIRNSNEDFFKIVVLHEFFHLLVQKVPNKQDATKIKDNFGNDFMSLIDIEADFYVALYLKTEKGYTNKKYWNDYFSGVQAFKDEWVRNKKFERFLGSVLTINKLFADDKCFDLFLPSISPLFTEDHLKVIVLKKEHIYFDTLSVSLEDLKPMKQIFLNPLHYNSVGYYTIIDNFAKKAGIIELTEQK